MKLIINADDFGLCNGVNKGIVQAYREGIVRSATMMVGMPGESQAVMLARENPNLKLGIHLRLTAGSPLNTTSRSLTQDNGTFLNQAQFYSNLSLDADEIEQEFRAQINRFFSLGLKATHFDSHHHCYQHPSAQSVIKKLSAEYNLPYRILSAEKALTDNDWEYRFSDAFYGNVSENLLLDIIDQYHNKTILEVMCHPGHVDNDLKSMSSYTQQRLHELEILSSPTLINALTSRGIELCTYEHLKITERQTQQP